ncbi:MAG: transposase [Leptospiraceae bacterium]|nr:transposase [Leptospiraceae bacterium]MCP5496304.1 transposase [Leptospiraceae bacterium]
MKNRKLVRLKNWNYSNFGYYFITFVTKYRIPWFGKLKNGIMVLSDYGKIANELWMEIPNHISDVVLDEFIIMPEHIHGILFIPSESLSQVDVKRNLEKIPVAIGSFKSAVSRKIRLLGQTDFQWQKSYHDRIIRDEFALSNIRNYIINNPIRHYFRGKIPWGKSRWEQACLFPTGLHPTILIDSYKIRMAA